MPTAREYDLLIMEAPGRRDVSPREPSVTSQSNPPAVLPLTLAVQWTKTANITDDNVTDQPKPAPRVPEYLSRVNASLHFHEYQRRHNRGTETALHHKCSCSPEAQPYGQSNACLIISRSNGHKTWHLYWPLLYLFEMPPSKAVSTTRSLHDP